MSLRTRKRSWRVVPLVPLAVWLGFLSFAHAATIQDFQALVDATTVAAGESIIYTLGIQSDADLDKLTPVPPAFTGFKIVGQPSSSVESRFTIINGRPQQSVRKTIAYELLAESPGEHVIGPATLTVDGQTVETQPINVTVTKSDTSGLPPSLQGEGLLNAQSRDRNINRQIQGKMFIRPVFAKKNPYVGEPVMISYFFYWDRALGAPAVPGIETLPQVQGAQVETLYLYQNQTQPQFAAEVIDGRTFARATLYQIAVTPASAAPLAVEGFSIKFAVRVNSGDFFGPSSVWVSCAGSRVELDVRPLPPVPSNLKFSGSVGALKLATSVDRDTASQGDILTFKVAIEGNGNIAQAYAPVLPKTPDFTIFDQTQRVEKINVAQGEMPRGRKVVEYLLRPSRAGDLSIPALNYVIFNPESEQYEALESGAIAVHVTPMADSAAVVASASSAPGPGAVPPHEITPGLRYPKPVLNLSLGRPRPLSESFLYWMVQGIPALAACALFIRARKRDRIDPAVLRRTRALAEFEKKIDKVRASVTTGDTASAAESLERALREFFADRAGISPEGLTIEEIARRCASEGWSSEETGRVIVVLNQCAGVRYAPPGGGGHDFAAAAAECLALLKGRVA